MTEQQLSGSHMFFLQIALPPLVESEEGRKGLSTVLRFTRHRYRQFRKRLSQEISDNKGKGCCCKNELSRF
jgi:hypothetical protein